MFLLRFLLCTLVFCILKTEAKCGCNLLDSDEDIIFECDVNSALLKATSSKGDDDFNIDDSGDMTSSSDIDDTDRRGGRRNRGRTGSGRHDGNRRTGRRSTYDSSEESDSDYDDDSRGGSGRSRYGSRHGSRRNGGNNRGMTREEEMENERIRQHILELAKKNDELASKVDQIPKLLKKVCKSSGAVPLSGGSGSNIVVLTSDGNGGSQLIPLSGLGNGPVILSGPGIMSGGGFSGSLQGEGPNRPGNNFEPNRPGNSISPNGNGFGPNRSNYGMWRGPNGRGGSGIPGCGNPGSGGNLGGCGLPPPGNRPYRPPYSERPGGPSGSNFPDRAPKLNCRCEDCRVKGRTY